MNRFVTIATGIAAGLISVAHAEEKPAGPPSVPPQVQGALSDLQDDWGALSAAHNRAARDTDRLVGELRSAYAKIDELTKENERLKGAKK